MAPAVNSVAEGRDGYASLRGADAIRAQTAAGSRCDCAAKTPQSVAEQCGTSLEMLSQHYSYEIDDFSHPGPRSGDEHDGARTELPFEQPRSRRKTARDRDACGRRL